jgi:hypothetical protein
MGEWSATSTTCKLLRFKLDYSQDHDLVVTDNHAVAYEAYQHPFPQIQGALSIDGKYFLTQSWTPHGHLITWDGQIPPKQVSNYSCALLKGPEDLSYRPDKKQLWTLSEAIDSGRNIFAVDPAGFVGESKKYC